MKWTQWGAGALLFYTITAVELCFVFIYGLVKCYRETGMTSFWDHHGVSSSMSRVSYQDASHSEHRASSGWMVSRLLNGNLWRNATRRVMQLGLSLLEMSIRVNILSSYMSDHGELPHVYPSNYTSGYCYRQSLAWATALGCFFIYLW